MNPEHTTTAGTYRAATTPQTAPESYHPPEESGELQSFKNNVAETAKETASSLKDEAIAAMHTAKEAGDDFVCEQKDRVVNSLDDYRLAMESACEKLEDEGQDAIARRARRIASQLGSVCGYLREKDTRSIFHDVEAFARKKPEIVLGGFFIAGLAAVRFLKASSHRDSESPRGPQALASPAPVTSASTFRTGYSPASL